MCVTNLRETLEGKVRYITSKKYITGKIGPIKSAEDSKENNTIKFEKF